MTSLYELSAEYKEALEVLSDPDLDQDMVKDTLEGLEGELKDKAKNVAAFYQNLLADVDAMKAAEQRIAARRKVLENKTNQMKDYLRDNMVACEINKIECPEFSISLRKPSDVVEVEDESLIPKEYFDTKVTLNKTRLKSALKDGCIDGAKLSKGKHAVIIK